MNEKLRVGNEERETSKKELQSVIEELNIVNKQLQGKNEELHRNINDLNNLFASSKLAVLLLDPQFRIKRFTPPMRRIWKLIPDDLDRPVTDVSGPTNDPSLLNDARQLLEGQVPGDQYVQHIDGAYYLRKMLPYRTWDDRIGGIVISYMDVTEQKKNENRLKTLNEELEREVEKRTWCVKLLQEIAIIANEAESVKEALTHTMARICRQLDWPVAHVYLQDRNNDELFVSSGIWYVKPDENVDEFRNATRKTSFRSGEGFIGKVIASKERDWCSDIHADPMFGRSQSLKKLGVRCVFAFPILMGTQVAGVLEFYACDETEPDLTLLDGLQQCGTQLGRVFERKSFEDKLIQRSSEEQQRIGQDLHDSIGPQLAGIAMLVRVVERKIDAGELPAPKTVKRIIAELGSTKRDVRRISRNLLPVELEPYELADNLEELAGDISRIYNLQCNFKCSQPIDIKDGFTATNFFLIARELVQNAVNHSNSKRIQIALAEDKDEAELQLSVQDYGVGFDKNESDSGIGFRTIRHRADRIGASLDIRSEKGQGSTIMCRLPL